MDTIQKIRKLFRSPALVKIYTWSQCVHKKVGLICFLRIIMVLVSLGFTVVTKELIDAAISSKYDSLIYFGIASVVLTFAEIGISYEISLLRTCASATLQRALQRMMIQSILQKPYVFLKRYHSGELINRVFSDVGVIRNGVLNELTGIVSMIVSFVGASTILVVLDWHFVLLLFGTGLIGLVTVILFRKPMKARHKRMQKEEDKLHSIIQEMVENIRLIKASTSEKRMMKQIGLRQESMEKEQIRQGKFSAIMGNGMDLMFNLSWLSCMLWGCFAIFRGEMTYGSLAAMIQLIGRVQGPIADAVSIIGDAYRVISSGERLMEVTELPSEKEGEILKDFDEICFENMTFCYDDGVDDVLRDINVCVHKGDFVALTGTSGGGKTSLFHLLLGIYLPKSGKIFICHDGKKIEACSGTRNLFAYVPQGNTLFSGTLYDNLTLFTDNADAHSIEQAVQAACIDDLVAEIGMNAEIGERGVGLSEGQAQRVAVARALLTGAPILLLDESTSALDEETEARMLNNISKMRDKTCLIVTHRRAALSICDYKLNIVNGEMTREETIYV